MMMILKKKEVLIGSLIMLILVAAFINYNYSTLPPNQENITQTMSSQQTDVSDEESEETARKMGEAQYVNSSADTISSDYFTQARLNRESARSKSTERLQEIVANENIDAQTRQKAQDDMLKIATSADKEASCENLIKAKGFTECVAYINEDSVSITVKTNGLSSSDIAKIQEIVSSQTGILTKNIKIVEVK